MSQNPVTYQTDRPAAKPTRRANRYVYHVHGHAKLHPVGGTPDGGSVVPFEVVLRRPFAITDDDEMEEVRLDVRGHIVKELAKQDSPFIVGDVMIRGVSKLHRILVDSDDLDGPAARVMA